MYPMNIHQSSPSESQHKSEGFFGWLPGSGIMNRVIEKTKVTVTVLYIYLYIHIILYSAHWLIQQVWALGLFGTICCIYVL